MTPYPWAPARPFTAFSPRPGVPAPSGSPDALAEGAAYSLPQTVSRIAELRNLTVVYSAGGRGGSSMGEFLDAAVERIRRARIVLEEAREAGDVFEMAVAADELDDALRIAHCHGIVPGGDSRLE
jgi:hypothetical protein